MQLVSSPQHYYRLWNSLRETNKIQSYYVGNDVLHLYYSTVNAPTIGNAIFAYFNTLFFENTPIKFCTTDFP